MCKRADGRGGGGGGGGEDGAYSAQDDPDARPTKASEQGLCKPRLSENIHSFVKPKTQLRGKSL